MYLVVFSFDIKVIVVLLTIFSIAFLYSSIGHGGASGYLAILTIMGFSSIFIKSSALVLNIVVSLISFIGFYKTGHFNFKKFYPFIVLSIPAAFLGAYMNLPEFYFKKILGLCLFLSIFKIMYQKENDEKQSEIPILWGLISGFFIGLISGLIGIGGGIILSPLLLLMNWSNIKQAAAISSLFIFLNSISGLLGQYFSNKFNLNSDFYLFIIFAILGGLLGTYFGSKKIKNKYLKLPLALALLIACIKLILS